MAKLIYALNQSLDGFVDHDRMGMEPDPVLFRHFIDDVSGLACAIYGRRMYDVMRYWDDDRPEWSEAQRDYARAWRAMPKWVVSRSLASVGPNATLIDDDVELAIRALKDRIDGEMEIAGPDLAGSMSELGLIDEYRIYLHPAVLGEGKRFFTRSPPRLRLVGHDRIGAETIRLTYVPGP